MSKERHRYVRMWGKGWRKGGGILKLYCFERKFRIVELCHARRNEGQR